VAPTGTSGSAGAPSPARELAWQFRELVERHDGWPVVYQVPEESLHLYVDMGLSLLKLGEEGRVPLDEFTLEGHRRKDLRNALRRIEERERCRFEIAPRERVPALMPRLRQVSDAWLGDKPAAEKGFSLGRFDPAYLERFPVALVRRDDAVIAFGNVLAAGEELSLDLMRFTPEAPPGVMTYLFTRMMLWGAAEGFHRFDLGMTPLAGLEGRTGAPLWNRVASLVYRHGEHFYNFQGLRRYKEKFDPVWEPRYLAFPGALALPQILVHLAALISGGVTAVFRR
jgi:phosphatidylglycerol lysyltransferase